MNRTLAVLWTLAIVLACTIPGQDLPGQQIPGLDKVGHVVLFAGFGVFWLRALGNRRAWAVIGAGCAFGILTEVYQGFLPWERRPDPYDALADAVGVALGVAAGWAARRFVRRKKAA